MCDAYLFPLVLLNGPTYLTFCLVNDAIMPDVDSVIPLDDEPSVADFAIIEAVQCLIEHQKVIFADPIETIRHEFGE